MEYLLRLNYRPTNLRRAITTLYQLYFRYNRPDVGFGEILRFIQRIAIGSI